MERYTTEPIPKDTSTDMLYFPAVQERTEAATTKIPGTSISFVGSDTARGLLNAGAGLAADFLSGADAAGGGVGVTRGVISLEAAAEAEATAFSAAAPASVRSRGGREGGRKGEYEEEERRRPSTTKQMTI